MKSTNTFMNAETLFQTAVRSDCRIQSNRTTHCALSKLCGMGQSAVQFSQRTMVSRMLKPFILAKAKLALLLVLIFSIPIVSFGATAHAPDRMSYQGYLVDSNGVPLGNDAPVNYDIVFRIYDAPQQGNLIWSEKQTVVFDKGQFGVVLGEGAVEGSEPRPNLSDVFISPTASDRYVGITVKNLSGTDAVIEPRLRLLPAPYSFLATTASNLVRADGTVMLTSDASQLLISAPIQSAGGNARGQGAVDLQTLRSSNTHVADGDDTVLSGGRDNRASGVGATVSGGFSNTALGHYSVVAGGRENTIEATASRSTISGGSRHTISGGNSMILGGVDNGVTGNYSLAAGRNAHANHNGTFVWSDSGTSVFESTQGNTFLIDASNGVGINKNNPSTTLDVNGTVTAAGLNIGGGSLSATGTSVKISSPIQSTGGNARGTDAVDLQTTRSNNSQVASGNQSVIGGGTKNQAGGVAATVSGGNQNSALGNYSVVGGGIQNTIEATAFRSTISGGSEHTISGSYSMISGGKENVVAGNYSMAAGHGAHANHGGTFVWSDNNGTAPFESTAGNQFLIDANGGVGINKNDPTTALDVNGTVKATTVTASQVVAPVISATVVTATVVAATTIGGNGTIPIGGIIMWSGTTIPDGWVVCDGNNGTPNMVDAIPRGPDNNGDIGQRWSRNHRNDGGRLNIYQRVHFIMRTE